MGQHQVSALNHQKQRRRNYHNDKQCQTGVASTHGICSISTGEIDGQGNIDGQDNQVAQIVLTKMEKS